MSTQKILKEFEIIYKNTYNKILKYVICKCSNLDDVNDIIQETYIEFYKKLKENKKIQDKQAFIIGIAKNKIMKYINQKGKIKTISIFQEKENEEKVVDIEKRNNNKGKYKQNMGIYKKSKSNIC